MRETFPKKIFSIGLIFISLLAVRVTSEISVQDTQLTAHTSGHEFTEKLSKVTAATTNLTAQFSELKSKQDDLKTLFADLQKDVVSLKSENIGIKIEVDAIQHVIKRMRYHKGSLTTREVVLTAVALAALVLIVMSGIQCMKYIMNAKYRRHSSHSGRAGRVSSMQTNSTFDSSVV